MTVPAHPATPSDEAPDPPRAPGLLGLLAEPLTADLVRGALRTVIDPELGVNIVDLGLVRRLVTAGGLVEIAMTLTTPGCPLGGFLEDQIRSSLATLPQARDVRIELVWDPPWRPEDMSATARQRLGWPARA